MRTFVFTCLLLLGMTTFAQDANFHIYLCLGQSNMEGNAKVEEQDTVAVDSRFQVLAAVDCPNLGRTKGNWYKAVPPLARCYTGLTPGDYFGRAMVANLPSNVRVGIINVAVGGCRIELFDKDNYQSYVATSPDWLKNMVKEYGGNPYARLVEMAKLAQKDGVIKGILLHQGESNTNDKDWPLKVKGVYDNLLNDLGLSAANVPLLADLDAVDFGENMDILEERWNKIFEGSKLNDVIGDAIVGALSSGDGAFKITADECSPYPIDSPAARF